MYEETKNRESNFNLKLVCQHHFVTRKIAFKTESPHSLNPKWVIK